MATTKTVSERFSGVTSESDALAQIKAVGRQYADHTVKGQSRMSDAAYATWQAVKFGIIREGRKTKDSPDVQFEHGEYGNLFARNPDDGKKAAQQVGLWIVLGYALSELNVEFSTTVGSLYQRLLKALQFGDVKTALRACKTQADLDKFVTDVLDIYVDANGAKYGKDERIKRGSGETPTPTSDDSDSDKPVTTEVTDDNAPEVFGAVARQVFTQIVPKLDDAAWATARTTLVGLLQGEDARRKEMQKAPAKRTRKATTKKAAAKKTA